MSSVSGDSFSYSSVGSRSGKNENTIAIGVFIILAVACGVIVWLLLIRKCRSDNDGVSASSGGLPAGMPTSATISSSGSTSASSLSSESSDSSSESSDSSSSESSSESSHQLPQSQKAMIDTQALTSAQSDSVGAMSPMRAVGFTRAMAAENEGGGPSMIADIGADRDEAYAKVVDGGSAAAFMTIPERPQSRTMAAPEELSSAAPTEASATSLTLFAQRGMSDEQYKNQEMGFRMPQTESWGMTSEQAKAQSRENATLLTLAAQDPRNAAKLTAKIASLSPVTLRGVLAASNASQSVIPEFSRTGVASHVAGASLMVRMGIVPPPAPPVVTGTGYSVSSTMQDTVARFNQSVAAQAAACQ